MLFRSQKMAFYSVSMPRENTWDIINELGQINSIQFIDSSPNEAAFARPFAPQIKRCEDAEQKLALIENAMVRFNFPLQKCSSVELFLKHLNQFMRNREKAGANYLEELENWIDDKYGQLNDQVTQYDQMLAKYNFYTQYKHVLIKTKEVLIDRFRNTARIEDIEAGEEQKEIYVRDIDLEGTKLSYIACIINKDGTDSFQKQLFRTTRGNNYTSQSDIMPQKDNEFEQEEVPKTLFLIAFQSGGAGALKSKLIKLIESWGARQFDVPLKDREYQDKLHNINVGIAEQESLISLTRKNINKILEELQRPRQMDLKQGNCSLLEELKLSLVKEKTIYFTMNFLKIQENICFGYCWIPDIDSVKNQVNKAVNSLQKNQFNVRLQQFSKRPVGLLPPTNFKLNDFTAPFQEIVNTYGTPRYREVNPGNFCAITFSFLFGMMFGDIGHGGALFILAILLCIKAPLLKNTELGVLVSVRYLLLMMGFFACYCGFLYNDFLSIPWNLFGSCYESVEGQHEAVRKPNCVYPFGLDPKWYIAENELAFFNSLKMKLAVIVGVIQMIFGIFLKGINCIHFGEYSELLFEFIPQLVFMCSTFGYMIALIFYKWAVDWVSYTTDTVPGTSVPPGIINVMINIPLKLGSTEGKPLWYSKLKAPLASSQETFQLYCLLVALICVPVMLLVKPLIAMITMPKHAKHEELPPVKTASEEVNQPLLQDNMKQQDDNNMQIEMTKKGGDDVKVDDHHKQKDNRSLIEQLGGDDPAKHDVGEVFVHQIIETIEFVLGSISNTASYLRLWALSLAHSQLAKVFFEKTIGGGISGGSVISVFIGWFLFFNITVGVMMCMDLMECFLHALRLQWVEFQNKFFKADGYQFAPLSFEQTLIDLGNPR